MGNAARLFMHQIKLLQTTLCTILWSCRPDEAHLERVVVELLSVCEQ